MVYKSSAIGSGGGGSGSGIQSINADTTAAQVIAAGAGISVSTSSGTTTITNTSAGSAGVSSVFGRTGVVSAQYGDYAFNLISGVAGVSQGGTGLQTLTAHGVLLGEGTSNVSAATIGISGRLLIDQGSAADPLFKPMSGDAIIAATGAITLATVNSNVGTFGSSNQVPSITANGKGLITAISVSTVAAPASLISGTTLPSTITASSLTTVGALASGSLVTGFTIVTPALGGTGVNNSSATGIAQWSNGVYNVSTGLFNGTTAITQAAGDASTKVATDAFVTTAVNNAIAGVNPAVAVVVATTQASDTSSLTYNNGVSGIGATFTGAVNTALTFDGVTLTSLTQRVLIKNDTQSPSGAFNGVYTLTQLQTGILAPILTRALDYDQPSDINNTGAIPVTSGTINASTTWVLTSTVNTVGTDPLTYTKFSINPSTIVVNNAANTFTAGIQYMNGATIEEAVFDNGNSGTSKTLNLDNGNWQKISITGAASITLAAPTNPGSFRLVATQDGTGHVYSYTGVKWVSGAQPTWSSAASAIDLVSFAYDGSNWYGMGGVGFA